MVSPTTCAYAPPGEYVKDHTLVFHDGRWHLFTISGTAGYSHLYNGNEETVSWSVSRDLVHWDFRGHVLHASLREGEFDRHEVWAPYCLKEAGRFHMFYTGVVHPSRPMCYEKLGTGHPEPVWTGHRETLGLAVSGDLTSWTKACDRENGLRIPGRDPHVVRDEQNGRWLLYSTGGSKGGLFEAYVSQSKDLLNWEFIGVCARFPGDEGWDFSTAESLTAMRHPLTGKWMLLGNRQYVLSGNPESFPADAVRAYFDGAPDGRAQRDRLGFAGEIIEWNGKWYRSGVLGVLDNWVLGFHEIEWDSDGAFRVTRPSIVKWQF